MENAKKVFLEEKKMQKIREDPTLKKARLKSALARAKRTLLQAARKTKTRIHVEPAAA